MYERVAKNAIVREDGIVTTHPHTIYAAMMHSKGQIFCNELNRNIILGQMVNIRKKL